MDWWFDRINLDPKIQIRYTDTKHQLADILTKGNFTRDEWNNLLHLFSIRHFSSTCCAKNSSLIRCPKKMAKRVREQKEEERVVAKSRPTAMNLSSTVPARSSSAKNLITSSDPGETHSCGETRQAGRGRNLRPDGASSSRSEAEPLSAVERQDTHRKDKVKKLVEKFENHPNKESFLQDFKQTKDINEFSKKSQGSHRLHEQHRAMS